MSKGQPGRVQRVVNIHNPSIEVHLAPREKANGMAVIIAAGGGNKELNVEFKERLQFGCSLTLAGYGYPYVQMRGPRLPVEVDEPDRQGRCAVGSLRAQHLERTNPCSARKFSRFRAGQPCCRGKCCARAASKTQRVR